MRNVVFLHKRTLYFAVASRKGCVDFSGRTLFRIKALVASHPARDAWILAILFTAKTDMQAGRISQGMRGF